jgi:hypothetical protein
MKASRQTPVEPGEAAATVPSIDELGSRRDEIADRRAMLKRRLDDGYRRIDAALKDGEDVARWEDFWLGLLREYEALVGRGERAA